mmetsp:Transcript_2024/g.3157  ORF Transcript_2024/g.3157 Transcript_2024/m.3157 type:complete len:312 (-) Transcript_2024:73-1008(-)
MYSLFFPLWTVDPASFSRLHKASFSQQTLMELVIKDIEKKEGIIGLSDKREYFENDNYIINWNGLTFDEYGQVTEIIWQDHMLENYFGGRIALKWLPASVKTLCAESNGLAGDISCEELPDALEVLWLADNKISGTLSRLPDKLSDLDLSQNLLSGTLDASIFPKQLRNLNLGRNSFSGKVQWDAFPQSLEYLRLPGNALTGSVLLEKLPRGLKLFDIEKNKCHGVIDISGIPPRIQKINLSHNDFDGKTDFTNLPRTLEELDVSHTDLSGSIVIDKSLKQKFIIKKSKVTMHKRTAKGKIVRKFSVDQLL